MWSRVALCFLVATAFASNSNPAWKSNTEYVYSVRGRSLTSLEEVSDQYSGIQFKGKLFITPKSNGVIQGRISDYYYAQIHTRMSNGFNTYIPEDELNYKQLPGDGKPFEIEMEHGVVRSLIVEKDLTKYEVNMIKSIVSQFQLDVSGKNGMESPFTIRGKYNDAVFKTMEETVTGKTETLYDIHELPEYYIQTTPYLVPQQHLKTEGQIIEVIKTQNYTNSWERPSYHFGFKEFSNEEPTSSAVENFLSRASSSRVILTGKLSKFTIQSIFASEKILVTPTENQHDMGSVESALNITLIHVQSRNGQSQELSNPIKVGNLIYSFESPKTNEISDKHYGSEESSEEDQSDEFQWLSGERKRYPRSLRAYYRRQEQPSPMMEQAPELPLLPNFMGYQGKSIKEHRNFDIKEQVKKITNEISDELKDSDKILTKSTLSKYTILSSLIRLMDEQELKFVAEEIYSESQEGQKDEWYIFRDAVAEAGTGPAFLTVQKWIETKKIQHLEAGLIVSTMASSVRTPTEQYMRKFFELVRSHNVVSQSGLNETAILSYCNLVNQVYVNKNVSHSQYPVHIFGKFRTQEGKKFVKETIIPYLSQQLDKAVHEADTRKIHVYIRALGNVGHKQILPAFEKYLEGKKQCSHFQRLMMVVCLDKLAVAYPEIARAVLYRIYQNAHEMQQIRVAAVYQIVRTQPPRELLQRMAMVTNFDRDQQVNAAVKSVIENLSQLRSPSHYYMRQAGEAARHMLTKKPFGVQNYLLLKDYVVEQMKQETLSTLQSMAHPESYWPNVLRYTVGKPLNQLNQQFFSVEYMISSVKELLNVLEEQTQNYHQQRSERSQHGSEKKLSSFKIAEILGMDLSQKEQLEGLIYSEMGALSHIFSFDNRSLEMLPEFFREKLEMLQNGKSFRTTKLGHAKQMALSFPTILGLPFLYTYDAPLLMKVKGQIKMVATPELFQNNKLSRPHEIYGELESDIVLSGKVESHLSFVTPYDHKQYLSGFTRNIQVSLPVRATYKFDFQNHESKIEFDTSKFDNRRIFHYSSWPYTSESDIMTVKPVASRPGTHIIKNENQREFKTVFGEKCTGVSMKLWAVHPEQSFNLGYLTHILRSEGPNAVWQYLIRGNTMQYSEFNFAVLPEKTTTEKVIIRLGHESKYFTSQGKQEEHLSQWLNEQDFESSARLQKMMKLASSEVKSAEVRVADAFLEFKGQQPKKYSLTLGVGKSNVNPRSNVFAFFRKTVGGKMTQAGLAIRSQFENTVGLELQYALQHQPTGRLEYEMFYQPMEQQRPYELKGAIKMTRTEARKSYLVESPEYKECKEEMKKGNYQLNSCANLTIRANFFDKIEMEMKSKHIDEQFVRAVKEIYQGAQWYYLPSLTVQKQHNQEDVIRMEVKFQPDFEYFNFTVETPEEKMKIQDLPLSEMAKTFVKTHPVFHLGSRFYGKALGFKLYRPICTLDKTAVLTFDTFSYPAKLDSEWTVLMQYVPKQARYHQQSISQQLKNQIENWVVLAREQPEQEKEVKIVFNSPETQGQEVEITLKSHNGQVSVIKDDGEQLPLSEEQSTDLFKNSVQIYKLPNQEVKIEFGNVFYLIFNGERVKITATSDKLRQSVLGLCGRFDENLSDEWQTPENCVVRNPKELINSYKVTESRESSTERSQCIPIEGPRYVNVIRETGTEQRSFEQDQQQEGEIQLRQRYVEEDGQICFTTRPVPVCKNGAIDTISKDVPVHCVPTSKTAVLFKQQIQRGGNPDFGHKQITKMMRMDVDRQCA